MKLENKKLKDVLPYEFFQEFYDDKANKYLENNVLEEITSYDPRFPFKHKNIYVWWILDNGYAVGWNENPKMGWSFPVKKLKGGI